MRSLNRNRRLIISAFIGIFIPWIPGFWFPGMIAAAIFFPEGVHSNYGLIYLLLAMTINFCLYAGLSYAVLTKFFASTLESNAFHTTSGPTSDRPMKGIIYTDSEIEEFKRRGRM